MLHGGTSLNAIPHELVPGDQSKQQGVPGLMKTTPIACVALAALGAAIVASPAEARQRHTDRHQAKHATAARHHSAKHAERYRHGRFIVRHHGWTRRVREAGEPPQQGFNLFGNFGGGSDLVADARRYLGTNPTNRRSLWCGAFMDKVLRDTGHRPGSNVAKAYLHYGQHVSGPQVGAIAVMGRRGGGHVGVVSGVDANGNPIVISGNHNRTVAESVYPRSRIIAYVMPGG